MQRELFVGSYLRRSDRQPFRIYRLEGTYTYRAYLNGSLLGDYGSKTAAMKAVGQ